MRRASFGLLSALLLLTGCGSSEIPHAKAHYGIFLAQPFTLKVPHDWEFRENFEGLRLVALSPVGQDNRQFRESLVVAVEPAAGDATALADQSLKEAREKLVDYKEVERGDGPQPWAIYTHTYRGQPLKVRAVFATHEGKGYIFVYSASAADYDGLKAIFEESARTISFQPADRDRLDAWLKSMHKVDEEMVKLKLKK